LDPRQWRAIPLALWLRQERVGKSGERETDDQRVGSANELVRPQVMTAASPGRQL